MSSDHSIERLEIQAYGLDSDLRNPICATLEGAQSHIVSVIEEVFAQHAWADVDIILSQIHLDVGVLPTQNFIPILTSRLKALLSEQLRLLHSSEEYAHTTSAFQEKTFSAVHKDRLAHLADFLLKGYSEYLQSDLNFDFTDFLLRLAEEQGAALSDLLKKLLSEEVVRYRLRQLRAEALQILKERIPALQLDLDQAYDFNLYSPLRLRHPLLVLLESYFKTGVFPTKTVYHSRDVIYFIWRVEEPTVLADLAHLILKNLTNNLFVNRLVELLDLHTLIHIFNGSKAFRDDMDMWRQLSVLFRGQKGDIVLSILFLKFLYYGRKDFRRQVDLVFTFLQSRSLSIEIQRLILQNVLQEHRHASPEIVAWLEALAEEADAHVRKIADPSNDLEIVLAYMSYGYPNIRPERLKVLLPKLWASEAKLLAEQLKTAWQEEGLRYRLAYSLDLEQIQQSQEQLWGNHSSAPLWQGLTASLQGLKTRLGDSLWEKILRRLHFQYFEYLHRHGSQSVDPLYWQGWMQEKLLHFLTQVHGTHEGARLTMLVFPEALQNSLWTSSLVQAIERKDPAQSLDILIQLLKLDLKAEVVLYVDLMLTETAMLKVIWKQDTLTLEVREKLYKSISGDRMKGLIEALTPEGYNALRAFLGDVWALLAQQLLGSESEELWRTFSIFLLDKLHLEKRLAGERQLEEALVGIMVERIGVQRLKALTLTLQQHFPHIWKTLRAYMVLGQSDVELQYVLNEAKVQPQQRVENESSNTEMEVVAWEEFLRLLERSFPSVSGFVHTYVLALEMLLERYHISGKLHIVDIQVSLYQYLVKNNSSFSTKAFLEVQLSVLGKVARVDVKVLKHDLHDIAMKEESLGRSRFVVLGEVLQGLANDFVEDSLVGLEAAGLNKELIQDLDNLRLIEVFQAFLRLESKDSEIEAFAKISYSDSFHMLEALSKTHPQQLVEILRFALAKPQERETFWNRADAKLKTLVIQVLLHSEQAALQDSLEELKKFLQYVVPEMSSSDLDDFVHKHLFDSLLKQPLSTGGFIRHFKHILQEFYQQKVKNLDAFSLNVEAYSKLGTLSPGLMLLIGEQTALFIRKGSVALPIKEESFDSWMAQQRAFVHLVVTGSQDAVRQQLELLFPNDILLYVGKGKHLPIPFWVELHHKATDQQLRRLLDAVAPSAFVYWSALRTEVEALVFEFPFYKSFLKTTSKDVFYLLEVLQTHDYDIDSELLAKHFITYVWGNGTQTLSQNEWHKFLIDSAITLRFPILAKSFNLYKVPAKELQDHQEGMSLEFSDLSSFLATVEQTYPSVYGFVKIYLFNLQEVLSVQGMDIHKIGNELYVFIYTYLEREQHAFSAQSFTAQVTQKVAVDMGMKMSDLSRSMRRVASTKADAGFAAYDILKELLRPTMEGDMDEEPSVANLILEPVDAQAYMEPDTFMDASEVQIVDIELFRKALLEYVHQGTWAALAVRNWSRGQFVSYLQDFFKEHQGRVFPLLKTSWPAASVMEAFVERGETEVVVQLLLDEFAGNRREEFGSWRVELQDLLLYLQPSVKVEVVKNSTSLAFFQLMATHSSSSVSLYAYVSAVVALLKREGVRLFEQPYKALEHYPQKNATSQLLQKALGWQEQQEHSQRRKELFKELIAQREPSPKSEVRIEGKLLIHNAGLVLLGPFLQRYLGKLDMLEGSAFKSENMAIRAVQLLQFLATGQVDMQEHELVFNKILCGLPLNTFIPSHLDITDEEKQVSESLLRGILTNWGKIKTQSIDALREGFLLRSGHLEESQSTWKLEVLRKAQDILVDMIPWAYSTIKMPWMSKSLSTKWGKDLGV